MRYSLAAHEAGHIAASFAFGAEECFVGQRIVSRDGQDVVSSYYVSAISPYETAPLSESERALILAMGYVAQTLNGKVDCELGEWTSQTDFENLAKLADDTAFERATEFYNKNFTMILNIAAALHENEHAVLLRADYPVEWK